MKFALVIVLGAAIPLLTAGQEITIDSTSPNGSLSFWGTQVGSTASVEWAASLTEPGRTNWNVLTNVVVSGESTTVDIPMFFRVRGVVNTNFATGVQFRIRAGQGGVISAPGATLTIPANALDQDTTITLTIKDKTQFPAPAFGEIASDVYEFSPAGLTFNLPAAMTIAFDPEVVPEGVSPWLLWYDEEEEIWEPHLESTVDGNTVTDSITHFSAGAAGFPVL